ncbi:hypothetical protein PLICRDRAFT_103444 [Plicaturopsis crispa FD-325 SS-3]|nr:hypothetical protein PLICRDRAFT_103444 [Plicaturopsis crispa FD-325 SS-3]
MSQPGNRRLGLADLLNPATVNIDPLIQRLVELSTASSGKVLVPDTIATELANAVVRVISASAVLADHPSHYTIPGVVRPPQPYSADILPAQISHNIRLNRKTLLTTLYTYPLGAYVEYPETCASDTIGHLFHLDPSDWKSPRLNMAYSMGLPGGGTKVGEEVTCVLLVDKDGRLVPCRERHWTCHGCKICPLADAETLSSPHTIATREAVKARLLLDRDDRLELASPSKDIFTKTAAYISALRTIGCPSALYEPTYLTGPESSQRQAYDESREKYRRGYEPLNKTCEGRIVFHTKSDGTPYLNNGSYDLRYLEAVLEEDAEEVDAIELAAQRLGYGPLVQCSTVSNFSEVKVFCPHDHRGSDGVLEQHELEHLPCKSIYRLYEPIAEWRKDCPRVLLTAHGVHTHPVPLPRKTPPTIRSELFALFRDMDGDLPDLTPRRFLRHPILKTYLSKRLPEVYLPTPIKDELFPSGTGWKGLLHAKTQQDALVPTENHYIRRIVDVDAATLSHHEEDELSSKSTSPQPGAEDRLRIIVCMSKESSRRLRATGQYLESDIGFKRVSGFYEFELGSFDRDARTTVIFSRVYLNRQTAAAHQLVFQLIDDIVYEDTGHRLRWRHLHAASLDQSEYMGTIIHWTVDQHGGQAKGLGLYLQSLAQQDPLRCDLHEPHRTLASLSPYEHLKRILRLCYVHIFRNINDCRVGEDVKILMRSLVCHVHHDWDGTLSEIRERGGKAAQDWVADKLRSKFAFPAMCWDLSYIPREIWSAGEGHTNLIESVHRDVNLEGVSCTLLGGYQKGLFFDSMKMKTLTVSYSYLPII